jgi:hypothetical protein
VGTTVYTHVYKYICIYVYIYIYIYIYIWVGEKEGGGGKRCEKERGKCVKEGGHKIGGGGGAKLRARGRRNGMKRRNEEGRTEEDRGIVDVNLELGWGWLQRNLRRATGPHGTGKEGITKRF